MTELHANHGHPAPGNGAGFEREDLGSKPIVAFVISVVVIGVLVYYSIWGMFKALNYYETKDQKTMSPMVRAEQDTRESDRQRTAQKVQHEFPSPRLEDDERTELNDVRYGEEEQLNSSGWVDQSSGVAHIPITRAMELIAQRGLPTKPQAGTAPASPVNTARAAAAQADTSNAPAQKKGKSQ
jgi:hypothetical protein